MRKALFFQAAVAVCLALELGLAGNARAQWIAFNDYAPGLGTHSNASISALSGAVALRNISNGAPVGVTVTVANTGAAAGAIQGRPDYGTPAHIVFDGYVDLAGKPNPGIELNTATNILTYTFSGLDPNSEYNFEGTAIRGDWNHVNRWSIFEITGAASFTSRHSPGALTTAEVSTLTASQVVIQTGFNIQGVLAWWEHIRPAGNGTFSVTCKHYTNTVPTGSSAGPKGYGITGFRLEKAATYSGRTNVPPRVPSVEPSTINGVGNVFVILMENHDWATIKGQPECPYINSLLPMASYCNQYYSALGVHPSEPNYLWLISGTNFGIRSDDPPSLNHQSSTRTLFNQLDAAGISWKAYQEDITGTTCPDVDSGNYAVRHDPFVFFDSVRNNSAYCLSHVRPYSEFARDLTNNSVARFNFISPNVTNDMHDLTPGSTSTRIQGDMWLSHEVPKILASPAYTNGGALFLTFDEGSSETDGPIGMIVLSPRAKGQGYNNNRLYTHSSTLRTFQEIFGVKPYLADAAYASSLGDLFKAIRVTSASWVANSFQLTVTNLVAGKTNYLQACPTLGATPWSTIATNVAVSSSQTFTDSDPSDRRFYRVVELP